MSTVTIVCTLNAPRCLSDDNYLIWMNDSFYTVLWFLLLAQNIWIGWICNASLCSHIEGSLIISYRNWLRMSIWRHYLACNTSVIIWYQECVCICFLQIIIIQLHLFSFLSRMRAARRWLQLRRRSYSCIIHYFLILHKFIRWNGLS